MENYSYLLNSNDLKATPQRLAILEIIEMKGHINIDELYKNVKSKFNSISLATIYKNINAMLEKTVLAEVKLPNNKNVYELVKQNHSHLLCKNCGAVIDIDLSTEQIEQTVTQEHNFSIDKTDVVLSGICKNCK